MSLTITSGNFAKIVKNAALDPGAADWSIGFLYQAPTAPSGQYGFFMNVNGTATPGLRFGVYGDGYATASIRRKAFAWIGSGATGPYIDGNSADPAACGDSNWRLFAVQRQSGEFQAWIGTLGASVVKLTNSSTPGAWNSTAFSGVATAGPYGNRADYYYGADRDGNNILSGMLPTKPWILIGDSFTETELNNILTQVDPLDVSAGPTLTTYVPLSTNTDITATEGSYDVVLIGSPSTGAEPWTPGGGAASAVAPSSTVSNAGGFQRSSDAATTNLQTMVDDAAADDTEYVYGTGNFVLGFDQLSTPGSYDVEIEIRGRKAP